MKIKCIDEWASDLVRKKIYTVTEKYKDNRGSWYYRLKEIGGSWRVDRFVPSCEYTNEEEI